jgi:hypothetical protein
VTIGRLSKLRTIAHAFRARRGRLTLALATLVGLFACLAVLQHRFVHSQVNAATRRELESFAAQITSELAYSNKWDLAGYRRASIVAPRWFILTHDGLIVDIEGFIPGIFGRASKLDEKIFQSPQTVETEVGEKWRLFGRKLNGGEVVLGISSYLNIADADEKLTKEALTFGVTIEQAAAVKSREIDFSVDYAAISDAGELKAAWGGVPLKIDPQPMIRALNSGVPFQSGRESYFLFSKEILNEAKEPIATVVVVKDVTAEQQTLRLQDKFNLMMIGGAGLAAVLLGAFLIVREVAASARHTSLADALEIGEGQAVEFKSSFEWDTNLNRQNKALRLATLKTIAAFLNSSGGTVFIGVTEETRNSPKLLGLKGDLDLAGGSTDKFLLTLRHVITDRIGSEFAPFIATRIESSDGKIVCLIDVDRAPQAAFVRWEEAGNGAARTKFFIREGNKTTELDNERTLRYVQIKWR